VCYELRLKTIMIVIAQVLSLIVAAWYQEFPETRPRDTLRRDTSKSHRPVQESRTRGASFRIFGRALGRLFQEIRAVFVHIRFAIVGGQHQWAATTRITLQEKNEELLTGFCGFLTRFKTKTGTQRGTG